MVISAGFAETGPEGAAAERRLVAQARGNGMRLVGPNCMGVVNTAADVRLDATFAPVQPAPGRVAFSSQSGALGIAILEDTARRGLGVSGSRPLYVLALRPESRTVVAGEARELESRRLTARDVNWIAGPPAGSDLQARVKIRYRHAEAAATLRPLPERRVAVEFDQPQRAVTPGQAAVFYDAGVCLGGGWIE